MPEGSEAPPPPRPRARLSSKQVKLLVVVAVVAVVVLLLLWGMVPERIYDVSDVVGSPGKYDGKTVSVKGNVVSWDMSSRTFTLADPNDGATTINVTHSGTFPSGFGLNVTAIVKGRFTGAGGVARMESTEIQIGCPSKY
jgi:cytochrome c-type biogenesis protein CcmE